MRPLAQLRTTRLVWWLLSITLLSVHLETVVIPAALNPNTCGFAAYYTASKVLLTRPRDLFRVYDDTWFQRELEKSGFSRDVDIYNVQPPTMSALMTVAAWLPPSAARVIWIAIAVASWFSGTVLLSGAISVRRKSTSCVVLFAAMTTGYVPIRENLRQGQSYALLFLLLVLHFSLLLQRDARARWAAGIPLGCMLVLKGAAAWLWLPLLFSRQWRTVLAAAATSLALALLCSPWIGWAPWSIYFRALPRLVSDPSRYVTAYQTVASLFGHLFVYDAYWNRRPVANYPILASLAATGVTCWALLQSIRAQRLCSDSLHARALSLGMFGALIVSLAPIAEGYHYVLVLPTLIISWWTVVDAGGSFRSWAAVVTGSLLLIVPYRLYGSPSIKDGWLAAAAYPRVYGAFVLWKWSTWRLGGSVENGMTQFPG